MDFRDLVIDAYATIGRTILIEVTPYYAYKNGARTETLEGFKYNVVLPDRKFKTLPIKIKGKKLMDTPTEFEDVVFDNLEVYLYMDSSNRLQIGARATDISVADTK